MTQEIELAWAAGLFDGEGCVGCYQKNRKWPSLKVSISQAANPEVLHRFKRAVGGYGNVTGGKVKIEGRKPVWSYAANNQDEVRAIAKLLWPYLSTPKKHQFNTALREWRRRRALTSR